MKIWGLLLIACLAQNLNLVLAVSCRLGRCVYSIKFYKNAKQAGTEVDCKLYFLRQEFNRIFIRFCLLDRKLFDTDKGCQQFFKTALYREASSVDTDGACIFVFLQDNCQGSTVKIAPGTGCHSNFKDCGINDSVASYKLC